MMAGLERDTDIVTNNQAAATTNATTIETTIVSKATKVAVTEEQETVLDDATNVMLNQVAFASDAASLSAAIANGANTLIIVQDSGGQIDVSATNGQALQAHQTIQGGASTIQIRGARTGTVVPFTAPGARPTLFSNANAAIVTLARHTHVAGLNITGPGAGGGNIGIFGQGQLGNIAATYNTISQTGGTGISVIHDVAGSGNLIINHNTISQPGADAIFVNFAATGSRNLTIQNNSISQPALDGIQFVSSGQAVGFIDVVQNVVINAGADAMRLDFGGNTVNRINVAWNTFTNPASDLLELDLEGDSRTSGTISNNTANGTTFGEGVEIDQDQNSFANLVISNNSLQNSFADPLDIDLDDNSTGFYQVVDNLFSSPQPASIIDIDTNDNASLDAQVARNTTNVNFDFDEDGASTFRLENTIATNTFLGASSAVLDPLIEIVPAGTIFPFP